MAKKPAYALIVLGLVGSLTIQLSAQGRTFIYYPPPVPSAELTSALRLGMQSPKEALILLRGFLNQATDRALVGSLLAQIADFESISGDLVAQRATLNRIVREFPNSNFEFEAAYNLLELDHGPNDPNSLINAIDALVQRFEGPGVTALGERDAAAIRKLRALPPHLQKSLGTAYRSLPYLYLDKGDTTHALRLAQLNREMGFSSYTPLTFVKMATGKFWDERTTQNPVVKVIKPTSHRSGNRPRLVVEISDGDYREPQLNWEKFAIRLDSQDLKKVASYKSQFDTKLREGHIFERLRVIYRPESALAPGPHTLVIYAPVHGYRGTGLGATRVEYRFVVPPPGQRGPGDKDDEQPEPDDRDFK